MLEIISNMIGGFKRLWGKLQNFFWSNKSQTNNQTTMNGFHNNKGTINVHNVSGVQTNNFCTETKYDLDPAYKCYFYKGERVCAKCFPEKISRLIKGNLGSISHLRCCECGKTYYQEN